jgi:hypothetical protein
MAPGGAGGTPLTRLGVPAGSRWGRKSLFVTTRSLQTSAGYRVRLETGRERRRDNAVDGNARAPQPHRIWWKTATRAK